MTYHKAHVSLFVFYMMGMTALMIYTGIGITPDRYALILVLASLILHRTRKFLLDWLPFLFILISYDFLRSLAPFLNPRVHFLEMINFDNLIFGQNPTLFLQKLSYHPGVLSWWDFLATMFYFLHFALPLAFAFVLWLKNRLYFKRFANAILILSYAAFITFVIFPAAPPWLAAKEGYLPGVVKILDFSLKVFPQRLNLPTIYESFNPNTVAAVPSLHAAYPLLVLFFAYRFFGKKGLLFIPYVIAVWWSIVYLGEHYLVDLVIGALYTIAAFYLSNLLFRLWQYSKVRNFFDKFSYLAPF